MIDTLRNGVRVVGATVLNGEMVYSFLMGMGWFFLLGWAVALVVTCASVFRQDGAFQFAGFSDKVRASKLVRKAQG